MILYSPPEKLGCKSLNGRVLSQVVIGPASGSRSFALKHLKTLIEFPHGPL